MQICLEAMELLTFRDWKLVHLELSPQKGHIFQVTVRQLVQLILTRQSLFIFVKDFKSNFAVSVNTQLRFLFNLEFLLIELTQLQSPQTVYYLYGLQYLFGIDPVTKRPACLRVRMYSRIPQLVDGDDSWLKGCL